MNKLVIFDLDGVLFESRDMHWMTLNQALVQSGYPPIAYEHHLKTYNGRPTRVKLEMLGVPPSVREQIQSDKQAATLGWVYKNVKRNDVLVGLFKALKSSGYQIAVASNAITITVTRALQLLGLWELCDFVTAGDRVEKPKPDPEMYLDCMKACDSDAAHTFIVEDSPVGVAGARASGAAVIEVTGPTDVVNKVGGLVG